MSATKDPVNNFLPLIVTGFTLPFEKSAHVGRCYKFTVNTHSPALWTDDERRSGMMPVLQSEVQAEHVQVY